MNAIYNLFCCCWHPNREENIPLIVQHDDGRVSATLDTSPANGFLQIPPGSLIKSASSEDLVHSHNPLDQIEIDLVRFEDSVKSEEEFPKEKICELKSKLNTIEELIRGLPAQDDSTVIIKLQKECEEYRKILLGRKDYRSYFPKRERRTSRSHSVLVRSNSVPMLSAHKPSPLLIHVNSLSSLSNENEEVNSGDM